MGDVGRAWSVPRYAERAGEGGDGGARRVGAVLVGSHEGRADDDGIHEWRHGGSEGRGRDSDPGNDGQRAGGAHALHRSGQCGKVKGAGVSGGSGTGGDVQPAGRGPLGRVELMVGCCGRGEARSGLPARGRLGNDVRP